jgi:hypothetical protein
MTRNKMLAAVLFAGGLAAVSLPQALASDDDKGWGESEAGVSEIKDDADDGLQSSGQSSGLMSLSDIRDQLIAEGYEVQSLERDDGYVEAYATRDGQRLELKVNPRDGRVLKIEEED